MSNFISRDVSFDDNNVKLLRNSYVIKKINYCDIIRIEIYKGFLLRNRPVLIAFCAIVILMGLSFIQFGFSKFYTSDVTISDWINFLFSRGSIFTTVAPILLIMAGIIVLYMTFIRSLIVAIETSSNTYKPRIKEIQKSEQVEDLISFLEHKNLKIYKHY